MLTAARFSRICATLVGAVSLAAVIAAGQTIAGCDLGAPVSPGNAAPTSSECTGDGGSLDLGCLALPSTDLFAQPEFDVFAWNSFVALNWPAVIPDKNNYQRGIPNKGQTFLDAASTDLLVWETYAEKRELFFHGLTPAPDPGPWNKCVQYGMPPGGPEHRTACAGRISGRTLLQPVKTPFDALDETVEVASEALEDPNVLCQGHTPNACPGSPCCKVNGMPVGPRVWMGRPTTDAPPPVGSKTGVQPVVYEVKVNYDFYDYVRTNKYYDDRIKSNAALAGVINLPVRTSATRFPSASFQPANAPRQYSAYECAQQYPTSVDPTGSQLPCRSGSVHLKAAWIWLADSLEDVPAKVAAKYHISEARYFKGEQDGAVEFEEGAFGLIGLHIIQRIHTQIKRTNPRPTVQRGQTNAVGGAFVFATWEHVDNESAGFTYSNYLPHSVPDPSAVAAGYYPTPPNAISVQRKFPMLNSTCQVNQQVHAAIKSENPDSVWLNYALIGAQFIPAEQDANPIGQTYYLANLVIETNDGLQEFQGQLPQLTPIASYDRVPANETYQYRRNGANTAYQYKSRGKSYRGTNMGGCMGCHGVAQLNGSAFSYVLLLGQAGASPDSELSFEVPTEPQ